jgi:FkbM family methyltransferase
MTMLTAILQKSINLVPWRIRSSIKYIPIIASLQRLILKNIVEGKEFEFLIKSGPAKGLKYPILLPDDKGVWTGGYEIDFVSELVSAVNANDVCFDIGGWRGYCGGAMATHKAKSVYIFEPLPENCTRIEKLIGLNPQLPITLVRTAVGAKNDTATFSLIEATSMGKLSSSPFQPNVTSANTINVEVISLDSWRNANTIPSPNVMKIDVEGAELMVLHGAKETIAESYPILFIECHSRHLTASVCDFLAKFQYSFSTLETKRAPDGKSEPEVCHLIAKPSRR